VPSRPTALAQVLGLAFWLALVFAAAAVGAIASVDAAPFYAQLARPPWAPPATAFAPVWSALYVLMGIAAWLVWREGRPAPAALALFAAQLAVNALWSWLFFAWREGALAFAGAVLLAVLILATCAAFWRVRRLAAALLVPYFLWVAFACALTWAVWHGNPGAL
jgi:benzodiazapine receptor